MAQGGIRHTGDYVWRWVASPNHQERRHWGSTSSEKSSPPDHPISPECTFSDVSATPRHSTSSADVTTLPPPPLSRSSSPGRATKAEITLARPAASSNLLRMSESSRRQERAPLVHGLHPTTTESVSVSSLETLPPRNITLPPRQPLPLSKDQAALYLAVYEREPQFDPIYDKSSTAKRDCSILVQCEAHIQNYTEHFCDMTSSSRHNHNRQFYVIPNLPNPRMNSPGLLGMHFIARIPQHRIGEVDAAIKYVDAHWTPLMTSRRNFWIDTVLLRLAQASLISHTQAQAMLLAKKRTLEKPHRGPFPNKALCFPSLRIDAASSEGI
ncbi:hypothetical protein EPUS_01345 [Endocarpon pusillum Z07020]|uniref:Uncharacterized protein n=1 Tax=Endocarpon pusillum (strain Z07020 / HMAS-L-300199) TaxID=1263415 RepID=U1I202_ENDPU|nr:uncharacterized protein EPUS_01345 [Endocarpon pusillum Z07020]ERF75979.1 hypothetical protein EPUS_01345 [Endocarpon pusillum Z07020]